MKSPGDNQALVSFELSCRMSYLNFALVLAELVHSFHSEAFHQKSYINLVCSALGKPVLLSELGGESITHLCPCPAPPNLYT